MIQIEVRKKIIEAREKGLSKAYGYSESAIHRLLRLARTRGDITPQTHLHGRKAELDDAGLAKLKKLTQSKPDMTLEEIKEEMQLAIGITAISEIVRKKSGFRLKKTIHAPERGRPDIVEKRTEWKSGRAKMNTANLVFLDESGVNTDMTRLYARAGCFIPLQDFSCRII